MPLKIRKAAMCRRNYYSVVLEILETINHQKAGIKSLNEPIINTTAPAGELALQIHGAIAEFERQRIRQRIQAGVRHARKSGKTLDRPKALTNEAANAVVKLHRQGTTVAQLSSTFGVSPPTIRKYLGSQSTDADFSTSIGGES